MARLYQGDFHGAAANLAEALRIYDPERDCDAKFRFAMDTGAGAAIYLALASWAMGDVERARALSDESLARADDTAHAPTRASISLRLQISALRMHHALHVSPGLGSKLGHDRTSCVAGAKRWTFRCLGLGARRCRASTIFPGTTEDVRPTCRCPWSWRNPLRGGGLTGFSFGGFNL
jgi:hypothetical protein